MKLRHLMLVVLTVIMLLFISIALYMNQELLGNSFRLPAGFEVDLDRVLIAIFFAGTLVAFFMYRSIRLDTNLTWKSSRSFIRALNNLYAGKCDDALLEIKKAHRKSGANYDILMTMGVIYKRLGRAEDAMASFQKAFSKKPTVQAFLKMIGTVTDTELSWNHEELTRLAQKIPRESRSTAYRSLLDYLKREGDWALALKVYQRGQKESDTQFSTEENAEIRYELGKKRGSRRIFKELIEDFPDFTPAYVRYAELLEQRGDDDEMMTILKEGFSRTHIVVFLQMIEDHLLTRENPERAVEELGQIVLNENHHLLARFYLGKLYYRLEMLEKAREIFENLEGEVEYIPALSYYLARIYHRKREYHTSVHYLEGLVERAHVLTFRFNCSHCHSPLDEWSERCPKCQTINSVRMIYEELKADSAPIFML